MKRFLVNSLATIGALSIVIVGLIVFVSYYEKSYLEMGIEEFGSAEKIDALNALFQRAKTEPNREKPIPVFREDLSYSITKRIPADWVPNSFKESWHKWGQQNLDLGFPTWGDVLAYYDESGELKGIEFYGSRMGCFISDDPKICPGDFESLHRIARKPIFVTIRVTDGD